MTLIAGARLNHYEILAPLGAGGMGEVYLAADTRLSRKVALKLLPEAFTQDAARVRRFVQEAQAASALNHPNILTIHEIGEAAGAHFIATEFIDGATLRQRLADERLPLNTALDIGIQTASALAAAHDAGIVHRDIKPENVMLRRDGIVKVLDFGLAKLTEQRRDAVDSEAPTLAKVNTDPGTVMGTASYMSPEQARGQEVDARSDIFSLGVVLYEIFTGHTPFEGLNALDVIGAILNREPAPLKSHAPDVPTELQRIVSKALRKDRDERYQHVKDLLLDLKDLKQELEFAAKLKGAGAFVVPPSGGSVETPGAGGTTNAQPAEAATNEVTAARTTSSAGIILGEIKRHKTGVAVGLLVALAFIALLAYGIYRFAAPQQTVARFQNVKLTRLTSLGNVAGGVSLSPDGKFIAYVQEEARRYSLWTKVIATRSVVQIVAPAEAELFNTLFSPDGNYLYYRQEGAFQTYSLYQIPVFGGTPKKLLTGIYSNSGVALAPDGKQLAFCRRSSDGATAQLIIAKADGSGERILTTRPFLERFRELAWSPDGKTIASTATRERANQNLDLIGISVESGASKPLLTSTPSLLLTGPVAWLEDGTGVILTAREPNSLNSQIWQLAYPSGEGRRITNDLTSYSALSLTADNNAMVTLQTETSSTLWVMPLETGGRARQITARGIHQDGSLGVRWTPNGSILYTSTAGGNPDVWMMNADGSNVRQLTDDAALEHEPAISPDGRYLVFSSTRSGKLNLWRTDVDGGNPKQLTFTGIDGPFDISPDGRWIIFDYRETGFIHLYKISIDGGDAIRLFDQLARYAAVSPDGKLIACLSGGRQSKGYKLLILPFEGGTPIKTIDDKTLQDSHSSEMRWTPDGRALLYLNPKQSFINLWRLPRDGGAPQPVTNFNDAKPERIQSFDLSRDGKQLVLARGGNSADVMLISEVK